MSRIEYAKKNIAFGYIGNITATVLGFVLRTVFIMQLNATLLGVNGLYTGVLSMLNMAELGIGTALNYSLYAPVARGDIEKVKSYMRLYRKCYTVIAAVVAGIGLAIVPFLRYIIKNPGIYTNKELTIYYLIFLFNTVTTYLVSFKYSLVNAEQKNYIQTNITTITKIVSTVIQIIVLLTMSNFLIYLIAASVVEVGSKVFVNAYLNKMYPYLLDKNVQPLKKEATDEVVTKTKALVFHKVGDVARLQTDSIIISSFISVTLVGIVDNYIMVITSISGFVNIIFNSVISSFGNLIATESKERQYEVFKVYRFFASWIYGFSAIGFWLLLTPLIRLWLGDEWILGQSILTWYLIDYYFKGNRIVLMNFKTAAGVYEPDKYLALIQGAVNLVISIVMVQKIGLAGVYVGTVVSGLIANITKPYIIYHYCFDMSCRSYFTESLKYLAVLFGSGAILWYISNIVNKSATIVSFILMVIIITVVFHIIFMIAFGRSKEMKYMIDIVKKRLKK